MVVEKCLLPVAIRPSLCPCLRVSPMQSLVPLAHPSPMVPRFPGRPRLPSTRSARGSTPLSYRSSHSRGNGPQWFSSAHCTRRAVTRARRRGRVRAYSRGRVAAGARHETLEKRRCPRMYFLIIDFNDEGSRCQRHLGCWAE